MVELGPFYQLWSDLTLDNYKQYKNFKTSGMGPVCLLRAIPLNKKFLSVQPWFMYDVRDFIEDYKWWYENKHTYGYYRSIFDCGLTQDLF